MRADGRFATCCLAAMVACSSPHANPAADSGPVETVDSGPADSGPVITDAGLAMDAGPADGGSLVCTEAFSYPLGYPCNTDSDCTTFHCAFAVGRPTGASAGVCTTTCENPNATDECPAWPARTATCETAYSVSINSPVDLSEGDFCIPTVPSALPGNATLPVGSPCGTSMDCAGTGAVCANYSYSGYYNYSFCLTPCGGTSGATCSSCQSCGDPFSDGNDYCQFAGPEPIGATCVHHTDCASFFCEDFCTQNCSANEPCPTNSICQTFTQNGQSGSLCIAPAQIAAIVDGAACLFDFQCLPTSACLLSDLTYTYMCTPIAPLGGACSSDTDCATGLDCRQFAEGASECSQGCGISGTCATGQACLAPQLDTDVKLFDSNLGGSSDDVTENDNIAFGTGTAWSKITYPAAAGTWWVSVGTDPFIGTNNYVGNYQLTITDSAGSPQPWTSLPNAPVGHNSLATAQVIPFPVDLAGSLTSSTQVDYYEFTVPQSTEITITTSAGPPSACLPKNQVAGEALGNPCTQDFNCASGQTCDPTLMVCTMPCTATTDCVDTGVACESIVTSSAPSAGSECVSQMAVGATADLAGCQFDWQCASGSSCVLTGAKSVCASVCGSTASCASGSACGNALDVVSGNLVAACLPNGNMSSTFGVACTLDSDCTTGLTCSKGTCAQPCTADSQCPYRPAFAADPVVCTPCVDNTPCTTATEEALCTDLGSNERYCLLPCMTNSDCAAGFTCVQADPVGALFTASACAPVDGSCHTPVCAGLATDGGTDGGSCAVPPAAYAEPCTANSDCTTEACISNCGGVACSTSQVCVTTPADGGVGCLALMPPANCSPACASTETCIANAVNRPVCATPQTLNLCTKSCSTSTDCACPSGDLVCAGQTCAVNPGYTQQIVPNDSFESAQILAGMFPITVFASVAPSDSASEQGGFFEVNLQAGTTVSIATRPVCGVASTGAEVLLELWSPTQSLLQEGFTNGYGSIHDFAVTTTGIYTIETIGEQTGASTIGFDYVLAVSPEITPAMP